MVSNVCAWTVIQCSVEIWLIALILPQLVWLYGRVLKYQSGQQCGFAPFVQKTQPKVEEEEEEEIRKQPDPLHQLILHFSHNALTECR